MKLIMETWRRFIKEKVMFDREPDREETYVVSLDDPKKDKLDQKVSADAQSTLGGERELSWDKLHKEVEKLYVLQNWDDAQERGEFIKHIQVNWRSEYQKLMQSLKNRPGGERDDVIAAWMLKKVDVFRLVKSKGPPGAAGIKTKRSKGSSSTAFGSTEDSLGAMGDDDNRRNWAAKGR